MTPYQRAEIWSEVTLVAYSLKNNVIRKQNLSDLLKDIDKLKELADKLCDCPDCDS
jgi:hypothetical protein